MVEHTMDVDGWLRKQLEEASPDLLRAMVQEFAEALMGAEADALCGAGYGERSPERVNRRNGYRERRLGHAGRHDRARRSRSCGRARYFPDWLLQPRRRAEQAFVSVIADAYLAGVSTRRVEKLVQQLGVERMSKSQVSRLAKSLDADRGGLPHPPARRRALPVPDAGRAGGQVPRGRPHGQRLRRARRRRQPRRLPRVARPRRRHQRGRRRLARVPALARRPRPRRRQAGQLGRAPRPRRRDRGDAAGREPGSAAARTSCATC